MKEISEILEHSPVLPVLTFKNTEEAVTVCRALYEEGIKVMEITMSHKSALDAIIAVKGDLPSDAYIGAGAIVSPEMAETAIAVGSTFGVSPGLTTELGRAARSLRWPFLPSASTLSEAMRANELGFKTIKYFSAGGNSNLQCLQDVAHILPQLSICPANATDQGNFTSYLNLPNVTAVSGTWMTPRNEQGLFNLDVIRKLVREMHSKLPQPEEEFV